MKRQEVLRVDYTPHKWQDLVHKSDARFRVVPAGRKFGKTTMCTAEAFNYLGRKNSVVWWCAPYQKVATIGWNRFLEMVPQRLIDRINRKDHLIEMINGSKIEFKSGDNPNCYDRETEILTNEGWKLFKNLTRDELVFTMDPETQIAEWQKPTAYIEEFYNGGMYHVKSKAVDLLVTPDHNEPRFIRGTNKIKLTKIRDISEYDSKPHKCIWESDKEFSDIWIAFLGMYLAEGSATNKGKGNYVITISQYMDLFWNILKQMPQKWRKTNGGFECNSKELYQKLKPLGYCYEKYIPRKYMDISSHQATLLLKYFRFGDGSLHKGQNIYFTTSKKLADQLQELILKKGNMAIIKTEENSNRIIKDRVVKSIRPLYVVRERISERLYYGSTNKGSYINKKPYDGKVYCVEVPNHIIYVRRNGKPCWSGNSLVGEGLDLLILDEAARIKEDVWYQTLRPNLDDPGHLGHCLMISCLTEDTLLWTPEGLKYLSEYIEPLKEELFGQYPLKEKVLDVDGFVETSLFHKSVETETIILETEKGFEIEGTKKHPLWVLNPELDFSWKQLKDFKVNDYVPILRGQEMFGDGAYIPTGFQNDKFHSSIPLDIPEKINKKWAYFLGLFISEGCYSNGLPWNITITNTDEAIQKFLSEEFNFKSYDGVHNILSSKNMINFLKFIGVESDGAKNKFIPKIMYKAEKNVMSSFLAGLFDGDGNSDNRGRVKYTSTSGRLISELKMVLLNYGLVPTENWNYTKPSKLIKSKSFVGRLVLNGPQRKKFYNEIGFRLERKQKNSKFVKPLSGRTGKNDIIPYINNLVLSGLRKSGVIPHRFDHLYTSEVISYYLAKEALKLIDKEFSEYQKLKSIIDKNYYYAKVKNIKNGRSKTYDFHIPESHRFIANGFISSNTPRGHNWFYEAFMLGLQKKYGYESWRVEYKNMNGGIPSWKNPYFDPSRLEDAMRLPKRIFLQEYGARFLQDLGAVFRGILQARRPETGDFAGPIEEYDYVAGVDWGKTNDYTVVVVLDDNGHVVDWDRFRGISWNLQVKRVAKVLEQYDAHGLCDSRGLGDPVFEMLYDHYDNVEGFKLTRGKKKQIIENLAIMIEKGNEKYQDTHSDEIGITYPDIPELIEELQVFGMLSRSGKLKYEAPSDFHDDWVIALALAAWQLRKQTQEPGFEFFAF